MKRLLYLLGIVFMIASVNAALDNADIYYSFDSEDIVGSDLIDLAGTINGTCSNMGTNCGVTVGKLKNASDFPGVTSNVAMGSGQVPNTDFSIAVWVNPDTTSTGTILAQHNSDADRFLYYVESSAALLNLGGSTVLSGGTVPSGSWTHLVLTRSGTNFSLYDDTVLVASGLDSGSVAVVNTFLGVTETSGGGKVFYFNGQMDEFALYDRALNQTEINDLYNNNTGFNPYEQPEPANLTTTLLPVYNINNITVNLTATNNTNLSYVLNGGNETSICNNCTFGQVNFTNLSGNYNVTWISNDAVGESNLTQSFEVLPTHTFTFYDNVRMQNVNAFSIDGTPYSNNFSFNASEYPIGNYSVQFTADGYLNKTLNFTVNLTNINNETINVTPTTLVVRAFDSTTLLPLTFNLSIQNASNFSSYVNQVNFSRYYDEVPTGDLTITVSAANYTDGQYLVTLNPDSSVTVDAFLSADVSTVVHQFTVQATDTGLAIGNATIEVQELINGSYVTISTKQTGDNGKTFFYLSTAKEYKVIFSKTDFVTATANTIPTVTDYTVKLNSELGTFSYVEDISYSITPSFSILNDNTTYNFTGFISGSSFTQTYFTVSLDNGTVLYNQNNTNPQGTTFLYNYFIPYETNISNVIVNLTYLVDTEFENIIRSYEVISFTNNSINKELENFGKLDDEESKLFRWFLLMIATCALIIGGAVAGISGVSLFVIPLWIGAAFFGWISSLYALTIVFLALIIFLGGRK